MTAHGERIFSRPYGLDNLQPRILPVGVDSDQTAPGPQRAPQGGYNALGAEIDAGFRPVWLGGDDEVEIGLGPARARNDRIEQESMVFAVKNQRYGAFIGRHARSGRDARPPVLLQKRA